MSPGLAPVMGHGGHQTVRAAVVPAILLLDADVPYCPADAPAAAIVARSATAPTRNVRALRIDIPPPLVPKRGESMPRPDERQTRSAGFGARASNLETEVRLLPGAIPQIAPEA